MPDNVLIFLIGSVHASFMKTKRREPAVAGMFYPADPVLLRREVEGYLAEVGTPEGPTPKALIAPHAGYVYSGIVAAHAYARVKPQSIERVVLIGPSHRVPLHGFAVTETACYKMPFGSIPLEPPPDLPINELAHALEHSLEVHLPFLQVVLGAFTLLPIIVGDATKEDVSDLLESLWGGPETLVVVSTDLSHYHRYREAEKIDQATNEAILAMNADALCKDSACGRIPIAGLLHLARRRRMTIEQVDLRNSGDTAGSKNQVVGYGAYVLY